MPRGRLLRLSQLYPEHLGTDWIGEKGTSSLLVVFVHCRLCHFAPSHIFIVVTDPYEREIPVTLVKTFRA